MNSMQFEALNHELTVALMLHQETLVELQDDINLFKDDSSLKTLINMRKNVSRLITIKEKIDLLKGIYHHGWGQDDTKHE